MSRRWWVAVLLIALVYTRFVGIDWGLPYPFHPDERNMASAVQQLHCDTAGFQPHVAWFKECFNPHFYAYGQLPLYVAYVFILLFKMAAQRFSQDASYIEATLALRTLSAVSSVVTFFILYRILRLLSPRVTHRFLIGTSLLFVFTPYAIQFAHFGTTESLLMLLYCAIVYLSIRIVDVRRVYRYGLALGVLLGLAIGIKISSGIFALLPCGVICYRYLRRTRGNLKRD